MSKLVAANDNKPGYYVYVWSSSDGQPFYVGKGKGRRAYDLYDRSEDFLAIHSKGGCTVEIVDWFIHESQALAHEIELIDRYGRRDMGGILVNKTDGGEGCAGHIKSPEAIEKWRAKNVGQKRSEEVCAKISLAKMGHTHSDEVKVKIGAAHKKRFEDPSERARVAAWTSNPSDETRERMSAAQKLRFSNPAERAKASAAAGKPHTNETRTKISATMTGVAKSAETVASMRVAQRMKPPRSRFKGVSLDGGKWRAAIRIDGETRYLGRHSAPEDAARAYDSEAIAAYGLGNCYLNFPPAANDNVQYSLAL